MYLAHFRRRQMRAGFEVVADLAKQPRPPLRRTAYHHCVGLGVFEHMLHMLRRMDVAVGNHRNADL
ncbi:hypothetical protein D3C83_273320 [compost metagenome]